MAPKEKPRVIGALTPRRGSDSEEIMASNYGFVYVLRNECMPGIYKIGMTDRAPSQRAEELSSGTAVPTAFEVVCFAETKEAAKAEREIHARLAEFRVEPNREFFALSGDDLSALFSFFQEEFCYVARGDLSFLSGHGWRKHIRRAQERVATSDSGVPISLIKGLPE